MENMIGNKTKHSLILEYVRAGISEGRYLPGQRIPGEAELAKQFGTTRTTVGKALHELEHAGLIVRRQGSGSYVQISRGQKQLTFGLLVPNLGEGEIFEPICNALATAAADRNHRLQWGQFSPNDAENRCQLAEKLCRSYIDQNVDGVFFAPIELASGMYQANAHIAEMLQQAKIPVVLLDCDVVKFPNRSCFDVVGIDNRRAGYVLAEHFLARGYRRIDFLARTHSAQTLDARIAGYRETLLNHKIPFKPNWIHQVDTSAPDFAKIFIEKNRPDAIICGNDHTAALLIASLIRQGVRIPKDIRISGVDDLKYASLLTVSLTTIRQPCSAIGQAAFQAMLERVVHPNFPGRDIFLDFELVVRDSSGK
jgi:DNA-binding LacI/PurR family transcriptional regulator